MNRGKATPLISQDLKHLFAYPVLGMKTFHRKASCLKMVKQTMMNKSLIKRRTMNKQMIRKKMTNKVKISMRMMNTG